MEYVPIVVGFPATMFDSSSCSCCPTSRYGHGVRYGGSCQIRRFKGQKPDKTSASTLLASNDGNGLRAVIGQTERETTERETAETTERETEHAAARTLQSLSTAACVLSTAACVLSTVTSTASTRPTAACVQHDLGTIKTVWPQDTEMLRSLLMIVLAG